MTLNLNDGDWVPLFRKIRSNWVWQDPEALRAWLDIVMSANYRESTFSFRGAILPVRPAQLAITTLGLAERWGWSRDRVRRFLTKLEADTMLRLEPRTWDACAARWMSRKTDSGILLLTVINYPLKREAENQPTGEPTPKPTGNRQEPCQETDRNHATSKKGEEGQEGGEGENARASRRLHWDTVDWMRSQRREHLRRDKDRKLDSQPPNREHEERWRAPLRLFDDGTGRLFELLQEAYQAGLFNETDAICVAESIRIRGRLPDSWSPECKQGEPPDSWSPGLLPDRQRSPEEFVEEVKLETEFCDGICFQEGCAVCG